MARYIDADALYKETEKKIKEANSYRMAVVDSEFLDLINDADEADVVPRDEVQEIFKEFDRMLERYAYEPYYTVQDMEIEVNILKEKYTKGGEQK